MRSIAAALLLLASGTLTTNAQTLDAVLKRGKILVGVNIASPPFGTTDAKMEPDGYDVDIAKMLAKDLGVALEIVSVTNENRIPTLLTGKADVIAATLQITPERAKSVLFTSPYGMHQSMVIGPPELKIASLAELAGKRVGVARGSAYANILAQANIPGMQLIQFADDSANLNALVAGQVDAAGTVSYLAAELKKRYPEKGFDQKIKLTDNVYAMGVRRGDLDFQRWVNTFLFVNILNGKIGQTYEKWMGDAWKPLPAF
ncbi:ABC transporter substrate-binding protein [Bosea sp. PAMC 26642]|nr:ABC transporter substrate-binding protein [Bosea sp. PAMC 26642]